MLQKNLTLHQVFVNRAITGAIGATTAWPMNLQKRIQPRDFQPKPAKAPCPLEVVFYQISVGFPNATRAHFVRHHRNQMPKTTRWGEIFFEFRLEVACERRVLDAFNQNRLKDGFKKTGVYFFQKLHKSAAAQTNPDLCRPL